MKTGTTTLMKRLNQTFLARRLDTFNLLNPTIARYRDTWNYSAAQHGLESWGTSDEHAPLFRSKIWGTAAKERVLD
ncbi:hypothetical protein PSTG_18952, partial [Puccinia striiformis f. sp. tritici PST-78]